MKIFRKIACFAVLALVVAASFAPIARADSFQPAETGEVVPHRPVGALPRRVVPLHPVAESAGR